MQKDILKPNYVFVASAQDVAGQTLAQSLMKLGNFVPIEGENTSGKSYLSRQFETLRLHISSESVLDLDSLDTLYADCNAFIFLSKHKSDSAIPTLTCHSVGNFSDNPYGGKPKELGIAFPGFQKHYIKLITARKKELPDYEVIIEATHHGPTSLSKPALFVELGSSESHWSDSHAASIICSCLLEIVDHGVLACDQVGIGLGGTHYPTKFNDLLLNSNLGLAAIASKHNLAALDGDMINQMIAKSAEPVTCIIVDVKGLGAQKDRILQLVQKTGLKMITA